MRRGTTVGITWTRPAGAADYDVDLNLSDGGKVLDVTGKRERHVVLHTTSRDSLTITVRVAGVRLDNVSGPAVRATSTGR
jgi:hypothetical protein